MIRKIENTTYSKNTRTGGIVNHDISGYNARKMVINKNKIQDSRIRNLETTVKSLILKIEQLIEVNK